MFQLISGGLVAQSISVAAELGIADLLAHGPKATAHLATSTGVDAGKLYRLLRFLASVGVFAEDAHGAWSLTPLADLLRSEAPQSMRAGARMLGRMAAAWPRLGETVRTGQCAYTLAFGRPIFEDLAHKPEDAAIFDSAMTSFHGGETDAVLNAYSYDGIAVLADIGCGIGAMMAATLGRYPDMRGVLFDQAHVLERTAAHLQVSGVADRCSLVAGSFFEEVPPGADAYTMRHILHDWHDDQCIAILGAIRRAIPEHARLLIIETVVPTGNDPSPSKLFDMFMMALPDGLERTEAQFHTILNASGFRLTGITASASPVSVIEARPV
jgi:hypothetical protein